MTRYTTTIKVEAAQWTGENLNEMKQLLAPFVEHGPEGPEVYAEYIESYFFPSSGISGGGYYMLEFYSGSRKEELDPGHWVVTYDNGDVEVMSEQQFKKMGFK